MTIKHWIWIFSGLYVWALLVFAWTTGPYDCSPPDVHHRVTCKHR